VFAHIHIQYNFLNISIQLWIKKLIIYEDIELLIEMFAELRPNVFHFVIH